MLNNQIPFYEEDLLCTECNDPHGEDMGSPYAQTAMQYMLGLQCNDCRTEDVQKIRDSFEELDQSWRYMSNEMNDYLNEVSGSDDFDEYGECLP